MAEGTDRSRVRRAPRRRAPHLQVVDSAPDPELSYEDLVAEVERLRAALITVAADATRGIAGSGFRSRS